ncbi:nucleoside recognition domain-containing protein [Tepidibacillus fermentans]|uniref:Nucleoside recognition protein n=1 Tax=Tepidibacillus fermentans TaxID=1281767 RepID=A0A4R3KF57_9BACI|nr:nucleoside recognition domain-containing protein [Tepidibacillus fermentans]TCS81810.1 nucleoside recognition protein [Tepidibacillus fermentans]
MITKETWKKGILSGVKTTWVLGKVIFPITFIVTILNFTPVIHWVVRIFYPLMKWIGLPGEAAIPLALGYLLNLYAAIGAILSLHLTVKHVFILAVMLSFAHNLLVETAVAKKIGVHAIVPIGIRVGLSFIAAFLINLFWHGGGEAAQYGLVASTTQNPETWTGIVLFAIEKSALGIWQIVIIVFPLMLAIQVLKDFHAIETISKWLEPLTRILGLSSGKTSVPLLAGLIFGLAYGAGVIIESAKEENLSKRDLYLLSIFLVASHAVIEDTLIFVPLGINVLYLLLIRVSVAFLITILTAKVWQRIIVHTDFVVKGEAK